MANLIEDPDHENNARKEHVRAFKLYFISLYNILEKLVKSQKKIMHMLEDHARVRR